MRYFLAFLSLLVLAACQTPPETSGPVYSDAEVKKMVSLMEKGELEGRTLNAKQIKAFFEGANVRGVSRHGERIGFSLSKEGEKMFKLFATFYDEKGEIIRKDEGYWWTAGDKKLCGKLKTYDRYRPHCFVVGWHEADFFLSDRGNDQVFWFQVFSLYDPSARVQSYDKSGSEETNKPYEYQFGRLVGYSEVCGEFRGSAADPRAIQTVKELFYHDPNFKRGYAEFENFTGFDIVNGLTSCEQVKEAVEKIYKTIRAAKG